MIKNMLEAFSPETQLRWKLEGIFLPEIRKRRDEYYRSSRRLVHYTSAEAALKIIGTKRLWMRNTTCMAGTREVEHGHNMLASFFSRERERFVSALQSYAPGAVVEILNLFDKWWATPNFRFSTYISSMAEHDNNEDLNGRLSMWRGFGGTSGRVALVFQVPVLPDAAELLNLTFSPVAYLNEDKVPGQHELGHRQHKCERRFLADFGQASNSRLALFNALNRRYVREA